MKLKYLKTWVDRKTGIAYARFRRKGFPEIQLPGVLGSAEMMQHYFTALNGGTPLAIAGTIGATRTLTGSVADVIAQYMAADYGASSTVKALKPQSQTQHRHVLERFRKAHGHRLIRQMPRKFIEEQIEGLTPASAKHWLKAVRRLLQFAQRRELIESDPTTGITVKTPKSEGHLTWNEEQIAQFRAHWSHGTVQRLIFELALFTGQRISDVVRMGRQHVKKGEIKIQQQKTGTWVTIPIHPELAAAMQHAATDNLTFVRNTRGGNVSAHRGSLVLADAARDAGLEGYTAHGLRKACCVRLAEQGCSVTEIAAISGHITLAEIQRYVAAYDRERAARSAMAKLQAAR